MGERASGRAAPLYGRRRGTLGLLLAFSCFAAKRSKTLTALGWGGGEGRGNGRGPGRARGGGEGRGERERERKRERESEGNSLPSAAPQHPR